MLVFSEICPGDLIKVLVNVEEIEDEMFAKVEENRDDYLIVRYFNETTLTYKGARIYTLETDTNLLREESLCEHFPEGDTIFTCISEEDNMYVVSGEEDDEAASVVYDDSDDNGSDMGSFIVSDSEIEGRIELPPDHESIDKAWNEWKPRSVGSSRFKQMVSEIEERARIQMDNVNF
jgi:hypothetical protein